MQMGSVLTKLGQLGTAILGAGTVAVGAGKLLGKALQYKAVTTDISPTQAAASNIITARCYLEDSLVNLDETKNVFRAVHVMYCGVLCVNLENRSAVQKGEFVGSHIGAAMTNGIGLAHYEDAFAAIESLHDDYGLEADPGDQPPPPTFSDIKNRVSGYLEQVARAPGHTLHERNDPVAGSGFSGHVDDHANRMIKDGLFPAGQLLKIHTQIPVGGGNFITQSLSLLVRINPIAVSQRVMEEILNYGSHFPKELSQFKRTMNEVMFWKQFTSNTREQDFLNSFHPDKEQFRNFLKDLKQKESSFTKNRASALLTGSLGSFSANLANTILFVREDTLKKVKKEVGFDFLHEDVREKFFRKTYCMMIVVFDEYYHRISIYMNGVPFVGQYTYNDFMPNKKLDTDTLLSLFSNVGNNAIRQSRF